MSRDTASNPCFAENARARYGRVHLPVAPRSNIRPRYGAPESPGRALSPRDVTQWLERLLADGTRVEMIAVAGPGDPLAEPGPTLETLRLVHGAHPEIPLTIATNGLNGAALAGELAALPLAHITVLVDAVDPAVVERLYAWIRPGTRTVPLPEAAQLLVAAQARTIQAFKAAGLRVKVNTTVYPGLNDDHVEEVARAVSALGADLMALVPFQPTCCQEGAPRPPDEALMAGLRAKAGNHIALMPPVEACGRDAADPEHGISPLDQPGPLLPRPTAERPNVAVASSGGMDVDLHLGQAIRFLVYGPRPGDGLPSLLGTREAPEPGGGDARWLALAETLKDCFALLASSAGAQPRQILNEHGITVLVGEAEVSGAVDALYGGGKKPGKKRT